MLTCTSQGSQCPINWTVPVSAPRTAKSGINVPATRSLQKGRAPSMQSEMQIADIRFKPIGRLHVRTFKSFESPAALSIERGHLGPARELSYVLLTSGR